MDQKTNNDDRLYIVKDLKNGKYQMTVRIERKSFDENYSENLAKKAKTVEIKGFRKGMVPTSVVEDNMKDVVLKETFEKIAPDLVMFALKEEDLTPLVPIKYTKISELTGKENIEFDVEIVTVPKFKLCDVKKIKVSKKDSTVSDKELQDTINAMYDNQKETENAAKKTDDASKTGSKKDKDEKPEKDEKRVIDDKWATAIAAKYQLKGVTSLAKLKEEIKKLLQNKKTELIEREFERDILAEAVKLSKIEIPKEAIEYESAQREHSFMHQLEDMNISMEQYLQTYNLTHEKLHEAWDTDSKQALEEHLLLNEYAKGADIKFDQNEFIQFLQSSGAPKEYFQDYNWLQSMQSLFFKNKAFEKLTSEVKANLGIKDDSAKKKIELVS